MVIFHGAVQTATPPAQTHTQPLLTGPAEVPDVISRDKAAEQHKGALSLWYGGTDRSRGTQVWLSGDSSQTWMHSGQLWKQFIFRNRVSKFHLFLLFFWIPWLTCSSCPHFFPTVRMCGRQADRFTGASKEEKHIHYIRHRLSACVNSFQFLLLSHFID